jgi:hypothetical protein
MVAVWKQPTAPASEPPQSALILRRMTTRMLRASDPPSTDAVGWAWHEWGLPRRAVVRPRERRRIALWTCSLGAGLGMLALFAGFLVFVSALARHERTPTDRADGIVALTGGAQRIGDAIDLLAGGYGRRLLITGVNERTRSPG